MYFKVQCCGASQKIEWIRICIEETKLFYLTFRQKIKIDQILVGSNMYTIRCMFPYGLNSSTFRVFWGK